MSIVRAGRRTDPSAGNVGRSTTRLSSAVADCPTSKLDMISAAGTLKTLFISSPDCSFLWKGSRLLPCVHQQCANLGARIVFHMRRHIENHRCPLLGLIGLHFRYGGVVWVGGFGQIDPGIDRKSGWWGKR